MNKNKSAIIMKAFKDAETCAHPADRQVQLGFGIFCDVCKIRLRLLTQAESEKKILDDVSSMMGIR